jgi:hypothetical protein
MSRLRIGLACVTILIASALLPVVLTGGDVASAAPFAGGDITAVCAGTLGPSTFTLTADCGPTTAPITVPDGFTIIGNGHIISAADPPGVPNTTYAGAVVTNAAGAHTMNIENLTVTGPAAGFSFVLPQNTCLTNGPPVGGFPGLFGIFFNDASGSVTNVKVLNIFQTNTAPGSPACNTGHDIRADGVTAPRTVTITNTQVSGYQKAGMFASGNMTMNVSGTAPGLCTIGPPSFVPFSIAQNGVQWTNTSSQSSPAVGASGTMTGCTIVGSSFVSTNPVDPASNASTAVLLFGARNVTIDHNTITGGSDIGISVVAASTNSTISFNTINRPNPPTPDSHGIGVSVDPDSTATTRLICNTFSGWKTNIDGAVQVSCTPFPDPPCGHAYSASVLTAQGGTPPYTWSASGALPPGLSMAPTGTVSGTPTTPGTFNFTATAIDSSSPPLTASGPQSITVQPDPACQAAPPAPTPTPPAPVAPITPISVPVTG